MLVHSCRGMFSNMANKRSPLLVLLLSSLILVGACSGSSGEQSVEPSVATSTSSSVETTTTSAAQDEQTLETASTLAPAPTVSVQRNPVAGGLPPESAEAIPTSPPPPPPPTTPPPTAPPPTAPPTTRCSPNSSELRRLQSEYDRAVMNYSRVRALAVYEGRTSDVRYLDQVYQANQQQLSVARNSLNQCLPTFWSFVTI